MYLTALTSFCGSPNLGGLPRIEYALLSMVNKDTFEPLVSANYNWQQTISFVEGDWLTMPVLPTRNRWEEKGNVGKHGPSYDQLVKGILPSMRPEASGELGKMAYRKFILRLTDNNGQKWLLGHPETPFLFRVGNATTNEGNGLNHYEFQFYSETSNRMTGYVPVF